MKNRIRSIQILRGTAALLVVIAHIFEHPAAEVAQWELVTGRFGVDIFFVISGFIIMSITPDGPFRPYGFVVRRILRVVPLYWLCTLLVFVIALAAPSVFKRTVADPAHLLASLAFVPVPTPLDPTDWRPMLKLGWTLQYEMFFYLVVALLYWCRSRLLRARIVTTLFGGLVLVSFFVEPQASRLAFYANSSLMSFVVGVWLAVAAEAGAFGTAGAGRSRALAVTAVAAIATTTLLYALPMADDVGVVDHVPLTLAAGLVVATGLFAEPWSRDDRLEFPLAVGDWSYSLYLTHMFVVGAAWAVAGRLHVASPVGLVLVGVGALATSIAVAALSYRLVEVPANALGRRLDDGGRRRGRDVRSSAGGDGPSSPPPTPATPSAAE